MVNQASLIQLTLVVAEEILSIHLISMELSKLAQMTVTPMAPQELMFHLMMLKIEIGAQQDKVEAEQVQILMEQSMDLAPPELMDILLSFGNNFILNKSYYIFLCFDTGVHTHSLFLSVSQSEEQIDEICSQQLIGDVG